MTCYDVSRMSLIPTLNIWPKRKADIETGARREAAHNGRKAGRLGWAGAQERGGRGTECARYGWLRLSIG